MKLGWLLLVACGSSSDSSQTVELAGARAKVPASWGAVTDGRPAKLEAAARREDAASQIELVTSGPDGKLGVALMHVVQSDDYSRGTTIPKMVTAIDDALHAAARENGASVDVEHACDEHQCTMDYNVGGMIAHIRQWRVDGKIVGTSCTAYSTSVGATCELPAPPPNAVAQ